MLMRSIIERMFLVHSTRNRRENMRFPINMAASSAWRTVLNKHPIFDELRKHKDDQRILNDSKNIFAIQDGEIFVWDAYHSHLLTTNLKNLVQRGDKQLLHQTLLCTCAPVDEITNLVFSPTGLHVALVGLRGLSVLELPRRFGKYAEFEGGKKSITCRNIPIGDRLFSTSSHLRVLQAEWHTGSNCSTHLTVLTSDNTIRIYDITEPNAPQQTIPLSDNDSEINSLSGRSRFSAALGDNVIAFCIGLPVELKLKNRKETSSSTPDQAWPVYLLRGSGDICMLYTSLVVKRLLKPQVIGPLVIHPPAEDNYGTDACAIWCLKSTPPVLVMATSEGKLHHCIALSSSTDQANASDATWSSSTSMAPYENLPEPLLYVFESIELELSLKTPTFNADESIPDDFSCPIRIHGDPAPNDRYHCSHNAGVHTVMLPWLPKLQQFCEDEDSSDILSYFNPDEHSLVEHLICTKPTQASLPSPVFGVCITNDHLLGTHLLCLTSDLECITLPLRHTDKITPIPPICMESNPKRMSPLRKALKEPFDQYIRRILQRNSSNPILKSGDRANLSQQECFQLLSRATQVFREEYVQKLDMARVQIERRVRFLCDQKQQQMSDLNQCNQSRNILTENARHLAEKFEDAQEKQQMLAERAGTVAKKIQCRLPWLTDAERKMKSELKTMEDRIKDFKASLDQIKTKQRFQENQQMIGKLAASSSPAINRNQMMKVKLVLKEEGDEIAELVKKINQLKMQADI